MRIKIFVYKDNMGFNEWNLPKLKKKMNSRIEENKERQEVEW